MMSAFHLVDTWRHKHPQTKAYSCFSSTHNSMSRIVFVLVSRSLTLRIIDTAFCPRLLSDHSPYWTTLSIPIDKPRKPWRLNPFWLTLLPEDNDLQNIWEHYFTENDQTASFSAIWDSFKIYIRTTISSLINKIKADSADTFNRAVTELNTTEQEYASNPNLDIANRLKMQSRIVNQIQFSKARQKLFFTKQKLFEHGEKAGKLLAYLVHSEDRYHSAESGGSTNYGSLYSDN